MARWGDFPEYVSAAERRARLARRIRAEEDNGETLQPIRIEGKVIARSYWGRSWCENLESYADIANRLERGRRYARNGSVIDLVVSKGKVRAKVMGSDLYFIEVDVEPLAMKRWKELVERCAGEVGSVVDVLRGKLPQSLLAALADRGSGLFPSPDELALECSCPDGAYCCKHVAATLYGVGARLDLEPETFFLLRGVEVTDLAARGAKALSGAPSLATAGFEAGELAELFGIELGGAAAEVPEVEHAGLPSPVTRRPKASRRRVGTAVTEAVTKAVKKAVKKASTKASTKVVNAIAAVVERKASKSRTTKAGAPAKRVGAPKKRGPGLR